MWANPVSTKASSPLFTMTRTFSPLSCFVCLPSASAHQSPPPNSPESNPISQPSPTLTATALPGISLVRTKRGGSGSSARFSLPVSTMCNSDDRIETCHSFSEYVAHCMWSPSAAEPAGLSVATQPPGTPGFCATQISPAEPSTNAAIAIFWTFFDPTQRVYAGGMRPSSAMSSRR